MQLIAAEAGQVFLAPLTVGGQDFEVIIDTGSSDPWLISPNYTCIEVLSGDVQDPALCYFGPPYRNTSSTTYARIPNENFNITYADMERLNGDMGFERFTMGGITVPRQKFATVDYAAWYGDGYSSGLVGFAYGTLTSAYAGEDPTQDQRGGTRMYNPLFTNMYNLSLIAPVFSLAIDREPGSGGVLALGGIPNIPHSRGWISATIESVGVFIGTTTPAYEFYSIDIDGFAYAANRRTQFNVYGNNNPRKRPIVAAGSAIVDSGTSLVYAPDAVAAGVAAAFRPPGAYDDDIGAYVVSCNARPPLFGVSISKKIFFVNAADMIIQRSQTDCISGIQPDHGGLTILGDVWMKNVLAVFDVGASRMRFAAREYSGLTTVSRPATT